MNRRTTSAEFALRRRLRGAAGSAAAAIFLTGSAVAAADGVSVGMTHDLARSVVTIAIGDAAFEVAHVGERRYDLMIDGSDPLDLSRLAAPPESAAIASVRLVETEVGDRTRFLLNCDCPPRARFAKGVLEMVFEAPSGGPVSPEEARKRTGQAPGGTEFAPRWSPAPAARGKITEAAGIVKPADPEAAEIETARRSLLEQLTKAADQGLLTYQPETGLSDNREPWTLERNAAPADGAQSAEAASPEPPVASPASAASEPPPMVAAPGELALRARTGTAIDFDHEEIAARLPAPCPSDAVAGLPPKPPNGEFNVEVARLRKKLVDDFDEADPEGVIAFAGFYVAHGFGAEALLALRGAGPAVGGSLEIRSLRDFASIVEDQPPDPTGPVIRFGACGGLFGLWAEAADATRGAWSDTEEYVERLLDDFAKAPPELRALLGAKLLRSRLDRGDSATAEQIDAVLRRTPVPEDDRLRYQRARLERALGRGSDQALWRLARRDDPESAGAILSLAAKHGPGSPPPQELADRISDAAELARGGPLEPMLVFNDIRLTALNRGAAPAFAKVGRALRRGTVPRDILTEAAHQAFEIGAPPSGPEAAADYARAALAAAELISPGRDGDPARAAIVRQLRAIGLPNVAAKLARAADDAEREEIRVLLEPEPEAESAATPETAPEISGAETKAPPASTPGAEGLGGMLREASELIVGAEAARRKAEKDLNGDG